MRVRRPPYGPFPSMDPFMTALAAALSLHARAQQYGSYAGIAAVFGLGVLSLLYFAQAREVKRLREWGGGPPRARAGPRSAGRGRWPGRRIGSRRRTSRPSRPPPSRHPRLRARLQW